MPSGKVLRRKRKVFDLSPFRCRHHHQPTSSYIILIISIENNEKCPCILVTAFDSKGPWPNLYQKTHFSLSSISPTYFRDLLLLAVGRRGVNVCAENRVPSLSPQLLGKGKGKGAPKNRIHSSSRCRLSACLPWVALLAVKFIVIAEFLLPLATIGIRYHMCQIFLAQQ